MFRSIIIACSVVLVSSCMPTAPETGSHSELRPVPEVSERTQDLLSQMTLDEKLGQVTQLAGGRSKNLNSRLTPDELDRVRRGEVGSYLHVAGAEPLLELQKVAVEESRLGIPLLFAMDVVHGYRTIFPVPIGMASTWSPEDWERAARISADEATSAGLHWTFAPMIDVTRDPRWGRIVEGAGSDPYLGSRMAEAQVRGYQGDDLSDGASMMAAAKHFGAYGAPIGGRDYGTADISDRSLHEIYLPPFYAASKAGSGSMMTAFNDIAGVPSTSNEFLIDGVLRQQWGFNGMIVSDWNAVAELMNHGVADSRSAAGALAVKAGVDMDMTSRVFADDLKAAIEANPDLEKDLDLAVMRILHAKERLGLFDNPYVYHDLSREAETLLHPDHRAEARRVAARSIVMLKNENRTLPVQTGGGDVVIIGGLAEDTLTQLGSWRAQGQKEDVISLISGLQSEAPEGVSVSYAGGPHPGDESFNLAPLVRAARAADHVILVIGEDFDLSGEARSRSDISLPESQQALADAVLAVDTPVTVVLVTGRPLAIPEVAENADAILNTWMMGVEAGPALADIIYGQVSPAGRLPHAFPYTTGQFPLTYSEYPAGRPAHADVERDTNRFMDVPIMPLYGFGHGLSYATFEYGEMSAAVTPDGVSISLPVTNQSDIAADEVVQLYMRDEVASVARPKTELRGFVRLSFEPGQTRTVTFELTPEQLAIYRSGGMWRSEPGTYSFYAGASASDIRQSLSVETSYDQTRPVPAPAIKTKVSVE